MESKFLTPTQLWQAFDPEGKLDVSFVSNETVNNIIIKTLYFNAFREEDGFVTGRLDNNLLVHFPGDKSLLGKMIPVMLSVCKGFYFIGQQSSDL